MKKKLLLLLFIIGFLQNNYSQAVGILGTALNGYTADDINLNQISQNEFVLLNQTFSTGTVKFRKDDSWAINWGSTDFPNGIGVQDGAEIPIPAGTYDIYFKINTGLYVFTPHYKISLIGTAITNGGFSGPDIDMTTTDDITYTLTNYTFRNGAIKFRQDHSWTTNWGGTNFPMGTGILNSSNDIPIPAGTYTVTFNRLNGTYTFVGTPFPAIGIWGPAVNSQLGYTAPDVKMNTTDGINYILGYYFSSGNAYFRQDDNSSLVWGNTIFPTGTATSSGPTLFIPGGEYYVTFNRLTGVYSFQFPVISLIGTAISDWNTDLVMNTNDGENYFIDYYPQELHFGECKFRKNYDWSTNWGGTDFPSGTAFTTSSNISIPTSGYNYVTFNRYTLQYSFIGLLNNETYKNNSFKIYPNPTNSNWNFTSKETIQSIEITDVLGKIVIKVKANSENAIIDSSSLNSGMYFAKISSENNSETVKLIKN